MQLKNSHIFSSLCNAICCLFSAVCNAIFSISGAVCNAFSDIFSAEWNAIYIFLVQCNTIFLDFPGQCALVFSTQCEMPFSPFPVQCVLCNAIFYFFSAVSGAICIIFCAVSHAIFLYFQCSVLCSLLYFQCKVIIKLFLDSVWGSIWRGNMGSCRCSIFPGSFQAGRSYSTYIYCITCPLLNKLCGFWILPVPCSIISTVRLYSIKNTGLLTQQGHTSFATRNFRCLFFCIPYSTESSLSWFVRHWKNMLIYFLRFFVGPRCSGK